MLQWKTAFREKLDRKRAIGFFLCKHGENQASFQFCLRYAAQFGGNRNGARFHLMHNRFVAWQRPIEYGRADCPH